MLICNHPLETDWPTGAGSQVYINGVAPVEPQLASMPSRPPAAPPPQRHAVSSPPEHLPPGEKACLTAAAQRTNGVRREQLTVLTGYKRSSRDAYIQRLKGRGYIEQRGSVLHATADGIAALGSDYDPLPTGDALRSRVLGELPEGERKVLEVLIASYPAAVDRASIDDVTGYKRSSRDAYLQRLRARELVQSDGSSVRASDDLFSDAA